MKQPIFLRVYLNGKLENVKQFADAQIVIGQNADLQMTLSGDEVAPLHAVIEERESGYYISDLGSQTGTFKNGNKVFDEKLESGDELQVGPYKLEFFIGVPKPKSAPPSAGATQISKPAPSIPKEAPPIPEMTSTSIPKPPPVVEKKSAEKTSVVNTPKRSAGFGNLANVFKKSEGSVVQVSTAWGDRVISTHHFSTAQEVTIGADESSDIVVPLVGFTQSKFTLLKLGPSVRICVPMEMSGDYYKDDMQMSLSDLKRKGRAIQVGNLFEIDLVQGEMIRLGLNNDEFSIFIRFAPDTPKPLVAPLLDMTASESTAVILAGVISAIFGLFMAFYSPTPLEDENLLEQPLRKAVVTFNAPRKKVVEVVEVAETPQQKKVDESKAKKATTTNPDPGKKAELRPNKTQAKSKQVSSAVNQGGAVKTTSKPAANAQSKNRDVGKEGLLSVFGSKGAQKQLSKAYSGTGELAGLAESATGSAGMNEDRAGDSLGSRLKNIGVGGKGTSTSGFSGVGTKSGKGSGTFGQGTGGIGERGKVDINIEGSDAEFRGSIDKEAIRRVIQANKRAFRFCYETALRKNSDLYGRLEIQWDIVERGRVQNAIVKSNSTGDGDFGRCVATKIRGLVFPEPPANEIARVVYPFVFTAQ